MPFLPMRMIRASGAANWPGSTASASRNWARRRTSASERDPEILRHSAVQGKTPLLAIGVEVEQCFFHCAKAFLRAHLWAHDSWPARDSLPSFACMLFDQIKPAGATVEDYERDIAEGNAARLY